MATVIHVYHAHAAALGDEVRRADPTRTVVALATAEALAAALPEIEVLFAPEPPRAGWASATRLRLVQLAGAGVDQLLPSPDLPAAVEVAGVRGEFAPEVAEHVLAMMLAHAHRHRVVAREVAARVFDQQPHGTLVGETVAIVGLGEIGGRIARLALAFGMRVRGASRRGRAIDGIAVTDVATAVADARYVVLAAPHTPATHRLVDAALLARLRPDAYLVNVARGELVDEAALIAALVAGRLAGAALDVFDTEPLPPDSPLWSAPNLTITPHVAGYGERYFARIAAILADNVRRLETNQPRRGVINRAADY